MRTRSVDKGFGTPTWFIREPFQCLLVALADLRSSGLDSMYVVESHLCSLDLARVVAHRRRAVEGHPSEDILRRPRGAICVCLSQPLLLHRVTPYFTLLFPATRQPRRSIPRIIATKLSLFLPGSPPVCSLIPSCAEFAIPTKVQQTACTSQFAKYATNVR